MNVSKKRQALLAQAVKWLRADEGGAMHREIIDTYNAIRPLPGGYRMSYTDPWCAAFVSAVGSKAGMGDVVLPECSCERMIALYKAAGRWTEADDYVPLPGDVIMFDWQDAEAYDGDNRGLADHAAIVESVRQNSITVIEGNASDSVGRRTLSVNGRYIRGYCLPDYERAESAMNAHEDEEDWETPWSGGAAAVFGGAAAYPTLGYGDMSVYTAMLQGALEYLGYKPRWYLGQWSDGEYGSATRSAVTEFQRSRALAANGICGMETWGAVFADRQ